MLLVVLIATASCDSTESDEPIDFREKSTVIRATPDDPPPSVTPVSGAITEHRKPVFNAEYRPDEAAGFTLQDECCSEVDRLGMHTLILPLDLDGSWRISCG